MTRLKSRPLDLTGAYYLRLEAPGLKPQTVRVANSDQAVAVFNDFRDGYRLASSEMGTDCGKVTDSKGDLIATICYNGRVKLPDGTFLDGMTGNEWLHHRVGV